ncbi:MAG: nitroreductase [Syntrophobacteraceae bacterium CG2_30_61_12]|nr:MAG: nitroreductase [Syntrophobacteraceae bacterium CG2_30_61_12]
MAELFDVIKGRRSVRKYEDREIPAEILQQVLEAVQWAQSWANTQCWELVLIRDAETKQKLQETLSKGNPSTKAVVEAPILVAVCGKRESSGYYKGQVTTKFGDWMLFDLGIATQNLCLAAHNAGLGSVVVGLFDHDAAGRVIAVPDGFELVALVPLGYPAKISAAPKRREIAEFTHQGKF